MSVSDSTSRGFYLFRDKWMLLLVMLLAVAALLGAVTTAEAGVITSWSGIQPTGITGTNLPIIVNGSGAKDAYPMNASTAKLYIDGVLIPRASYTASARTASSVYFYYNPKPPLSDGLHTFRVEMSDTSGRVSAHEWGAMIAQPPSASWLEPHADWVMYSGHPTITIRLADNTVGTTMDVTGAVRTGSASGPVLTTFGGTGLAAGDHSFTLAEELAPGTYYLTATITDAAGNARLLQGAAARRFTTSAATAMSVLPSNCLAAGCHVRTGHPATGTDCTSCHVTGYHESGQCGDCHDGHTGPVTVTDFFGKCESCHSVSYPSVPRHTVDSVRPAHEGSCDGCHNESLLDVHGVVPAGSSYAYQCTLCHESTTPRVIAAIVAGDTACDACHVGHEEVHTVDRTDPCADCHAGPSLTSLHADAGCDACHASADVTVVSAIAVGDKSCVTCHPDRVEAHGYPPEAHEASESCVLSCHTPLQGLTELKPVHDALATPVACAGCHPTKVDAIAPWDKTCTACHQISELHQAQAADHVGTDVAYQDASFFGGGCSDNTGHTGQSNCHDIANISTLHSQMPGNGCAVCHGDGKTPAQECLDCHQIGSATTYTRPGTVTNGVVTSSPSSDASITAGWTWTTTPAAQSRYAVVNTPYPPASTTRYMTVTSNAAGGALFGFDQLSIPANAKITDVRIYAKAKATNATYPRKMQGVLQIGGQTYPSSNLSANLSTGWTAGAGTAFSTSPTRIDYTREPLYGEMIWQNPKTGADWTPAQLNGTDPENSLTAFGVNLTSSTAANNVSLAQIYVKVTYYTMTAPVAFPTVGTHTYHVNNVKYLHDPSDAPAGQRFAVSPAHGWYDALFYQDCYDFCHRGNAGEPTFSAPQGSRMWYSVGGDPYDAVVATRTLALKPVTVPTDSPTLAFTTNYQLGSGAAGYVEISTDDGGTWTPLAGTVGGAATSSLTGNASGWVPASYDLSAYAGQSAKLRFRYVNGASQSAGWAFDSLTIGGTSGPVFSDDAETLKPDWTNTYWTRANGAFPF